MDRVIYIGSLLSEFISGDFKTKKLKDEASTDNKPVEQSIRSTKQVHEKKLWVDLGEVERLLEEGEVDTDKTPLTKRDVDMNNLLRLTSKA